ncbi:uncharacterized protein LOC141691990 [Apium graveolens]|uniref:uncharacterized protein LOC141691990 n=1 Tax=Apium graveolens TaxID=4045 RepID=UPI003D7A1280
MAENTENNQNNQAPVMDQSQNHTSPYYLHPSDNPDMKLVNIKFDGTGYGDWKRSMLISLSTKNKTGFVDGTITKPLIADPNYKGWERCNSMMISRLLGVLDQSIARSVLYFNTAHDIWINLEECYGQASGIRGNILVMNPLPAISHAYRLLLQEENHKKLLHPAHSSEEVMDFATNIRSFNFRPQGGSGSSFRPQSGESRGKFSSYFCDHCKMTGHTARRCYKLHGYSSHFKNDN